MRRRPAPPTRPAPRDGFTLVEVMMAMVILVICIVVLGQGSLRFSRGVADTSLRARAQALADAQIAMARTWPTYATLENLSLTAYNESIDGLVRTTSVTADTLGGRNVKRLVVTVRSARAGALAPDVVRAITVAAP